MIKIEVLDGKNTIGGTKILIGDKEFSFFLDFGKNFKTYSLYFEEFLSPRTLTGIYDLWKLNLIPKINNIYREDIFPPYLNEEKRVINLSGVFLSHAHLDHSGFISLIKENIPIITSSITKKFLEAIEVINPELFTQFTLVKKRYWNEDFGEKVSLSNKKKKKDGDFNEIEEKNRNFIEICDEKYENKLDNIKFISFKTDHSILGSLGFFIEMNGIGIAYTGDIRFHGKNSKYSYLFVNELKKLKPTILITEGTRVRSEKGNKKEEDVFKSSLKVINDFKGKVVISDFGPRNIERLETFLNIAKETKRYLLITYKDALLLDLLKDHFNLIDDDHILIIHEKKSDDRKYLRELKEKYKNKIVTPKIINDNLGDFIICYSFYDFVNLIDLEINDGAYIYSTSEAYTEEQEIDIKRLFNWLKYFNLKIFGVEINGDKPIFSGDYHSSGHASFDDIIWMINEINPEFILPVHTENLEEFVKIFGEGRVIKEETFEL
ncbi:MAG: ribonuclease J [Caldisericia bacterium]|jgi:ribonuclease J|nr:ribonuclease J [Caldisericia bacterium]